MLHWLLTQLPGIVIGAFLIGPFIPGVLRKIKAWFSKEGNVVKSKLPH